MKFIDDYKEFGADSNISVLDHISDEPIAEKEKILKYLKQFEDYGIRCATLTDYVTNTLYSPSVYVYTDGEYRWSDEEIYHFEKYNMELNEDFIKKVLSLQD